REAELLAADLARHRQASDDALRRLTTVFGQPARQSRRTLVQHEAADDGAVPPGDVEIARRDRVPDVLVEASGLPQIDALALLPSGGCIQQVHDPLGLERRCTIERETRPRYGYVDLIRRPSRGRTDAQPDRRKPGSCRWC